MTNTASLQSDILAQVSAAGDEAALEAVRVAALGKKGSISELMKTLGGIYQKLGKLDLADPLLMAALDTRRKTQGNESKIAESLVALGMLRKDQGRLEEAETLVRQGMAMSQRTQTEADTQIPDPNDATMFIRQRDLHWINLFDFHLSIPCRLLTHQCSTALIPGGDEDEVVFNNRSGTDGGGLIDRI